MKKILPNIYYFYHKGEFLFGVDAYTIEVAINNFYRQDLGEFDYITEYSRTFDKYSKMQRGDIMSSNSVD